MSEFESYTEDLHVAKFGGSSMLSMEVVAERMEELDARRLAVVSALGKSGIEGYVGPHEEKVTDRLISYWHNGDAETLDSIIESHRFEADRLNIFDTELARESLMDEFREAIVDAHTREDRADLEIQGEIMSARLFAAHTGFEFIDPREVMIFDDPNELGEQKIDLETTSRLLRAKMDDRTKKYVLAGYGGSYGGETKLFSRSGTDVSAAVAAVALGASTYENFKEVDGVFSADPRKVEEPVLIEEMTYDEARDYGNGGAEVLHPDVISYLWDVVDPSVRTKIVTVVRNTFKPECDGTRIVDRRTAGQDELILGMTVRDDFMYVKLHEYRMNDRSGYARDVAQFLAEYGVDGSDIGSLDEQTRTELGFEHMPTGTDSLTLILRKNQFAQWADSDNPSPKTNFDTFYDDMNTAFRGRIEAHGEIGSVHLIGKEHANPHKLGKIMMKAMGALIDAEVGIRGEITQIDGTSSVIFIETQRRRSALKEVHKAFFSEVA